MAIITKSIDQAAKRFVDITSSRGAEYQSGVESTPKDQAALAIAAIPTLRAAVSAASYANKVAAGLRRAGQAKWRRKSISVGVARFGPGGSASVDDYRSGFAPYLQTIQSIELPPRRVRGDVSNVDRVRIIAQELAAKRLAMSAAGG